MDLIAKTLAVCEELGVEEAAKFYGVSAGTISNWKRTQKPSAEAVQRTFDYYWVEPPLHISKAEGGELVQVQVPLYDRPSFKFCLSLMGLAKNSRHSLEIRPQGGTCIWRVRNILATNLLHSTAQWGFMVDSDMVFPWGNAGAFNSIIGEQAAIPAQFAGLHTIDRLIARKEPVIGVAYVSRHPRGALHYGEAFRSQGENRSTWGRVPCDQVQATSWVATGGLLYHRSVLERIIEKCPEVHPEGGVKPSPQNQEVWKFFSPAYVDENGVLHQDDGEDRAFMRRVTRAGFSPKVDLSLLAAHEGTVCWTTRNAQPR
jgi:hypothetical protein